MSDMKKVYGPFSCEGIKFCLMDDGEIRAWARGVSEQSLGCLRHSDSGKPWIPKHKNFNSICRQMVKDGDVDDLLKAYRRQRDLEKTMKKAAPELYEALASIENDDGRIPPAIWEMRNAALAKARGE